MIETKVLRLSDGTIMGLTDEETKAIFETKEDIVYLKRKDQYINKKYITSITRHWMADYKKI